jgi:hypothetical protein
MYSSRSTIVRTPPVVTALVASVPLPMSIVVAAVIAATFCTKTSLTIMILQQLERKKAMPQDHWKPRRLLNLK